MKTKARHFALPPQRARVRWPSPLFTDIQLRLRSWDRECHYGCDDSHSILRSHICSPQTNLADHDAPAWVRLILSRPAIGERRGGNFL
jgi:hypothetical protein